MKLIVFLVLISLVAGADKKPVQEDGNSNPFTSFFSTVLEYIQSGFSSIFGIESRSGSGRVNYRGFNLMRAVPRTPDQLTEMRGLEEEFDGVKYWKAPRVRNSTADFQVPPDLVENVKQFMRERQIEFEILSQDLQSKIARQNPKMSKEKRGELRKSMGHAMSWRRYHRYADIMAYMEYLAGKYPESVTVEKIGSSYGGLPLKVARVSTPQKTRGDSAKPAIWIDGGTHAREWISPAVATYVLKQLVENSQVNKQLLDNFDWYILPVVNPDGYEYSHTTDRLWRKTRSSGDDDDDSRRRRRRSISSRMAGMARVFFGSCEGVDLNRNWDYHWGERGASDDPCDETYAGPRAFSEPETRAISDFVMSNKENLKMFLTLHSYGQMWLLPWGYTKEKLVDYDDLMTLGQEAVQALTKVQGTEYKLGSATSLLYHSSGGSDDWAKGAAGVKYAYTVELPDTGENGFLLPAAQIIPTGKETFAAIKAMAKSLLPPKKSRPPPVSTTTSKPTATIAIIKNKPVTPKPKPKNKPPVTPQTSVNNTISQRGRGRVSFL